MKRKVDGVIEYTVEGNGAARLDVWLTEKLEGFSRSRIKGLIEAGLVLINGKAAVKPGEKLDAGDRVAVTIPPPVPAIPEPEDIPLAVIFEDDDIIVIDKPAGLVVHPAPGHHTGTLVNALLHHCPALSGIGGVARPGIVHRLDQDTSGVMIVAKSQRAMDVLTREFSSHKNLRKTYLALTHGTPVPNSGRIENLIGRSPYDRKKMAIVEKNGKLAITHYRLLEKLSHLSLMECVIETGRTHQIRVHLSSLGTPIVGDAVYGYSARDRALTPAPPRQLLHARRLELKHPVSGAPLFFEAPIPDEFNIYLNRPADF